MKKQIALLVTTLSLVLTGLSACSNTDYSDSQFVGRWKTWDTSTEADTETVITFEADGNGSIDVREGPIKDYDTITWKPLSKNEAQITHGGNQITCALLEKTSLEEDMTMTCDGVTFTKL